MGAIRRIEESLEGYVATVEAERKAYRELAHELGVRSGWLQPQDGSSWSQVDEAMKKIKDRGPR